MKKLVVMLLMFVFLTANIAFAGININKASKKELTNLPGVGEKKAEAIIAYRKKNGDFKKLEDLMKVKGIGPKVYKKLIKDIGL